MTAKTATTVSARMTATSAHPAATMSPTAAAPATAAMCQGAGDRTTCHQSSPYKTHESEADG
jgi:hypothetical protein